MFTPERMQTTAPSVLLLPQQLARTASTAGSSRTTGGKPPLPGSAAHKTSFDQFLRVEPWQVPLAQETIRFIRMSDLAHSALLRSLAVPQNRMPAELVESVYEQDQAAVNAALKDIGGLPVRVENSTQGLDVWMRMVEWCGVSEASPIAHTWLPHGQEGTNNTVDLSILALGEMEEHVARYAHPAA